MESGLWVRGMAGAVRIGGGSGGRTRWGTLAGASAVGGGIGWDVDAAAILGGAPTEPRSPGDGGPNVPREGPGVLDVLCALEESGEDVWSVCRELGVSGRTRRSGVIRGKFTQSDIVCYRTVLHEYLKNKLSRPLKPDHVNIPITCNSMDAVVTTNVTQLKALTMFRFSIVHPHSTRIEL
jgi:hypothetical protein